MEEKEHTIGSLTQLTEELRNQLNRQKSTYEAIIKEKGEAEVASHEALVDCEDRLNKMAARKTELEGRVDDLEGKLHEFSFEKDEVTEKLRQSDLRYAEKIGDSVALEQELASVQKSYADLEVKSNPKFC